MSDPTDTRRVVFEETNYWIADIYADDAEMIMMDEADICDVADALTSVRRTAPFAHPVEADLTVDPIEDTMFGDGYEAIDGTKPESYYWSARNAVMDARHILNRGRYREGNCREMDAVNASLGRVEEELRLLALAVDEERKTDALDGEGDSDE